MGEETMGGRIARLRREHGMTQADLANQMGVTDKAVSKWERDRSCPDLHSLPRLARALGVPVEELLPGENLTKQTAAPAAEGIVSIRRIAPLAGRAVAVAMGVAVVVLSRLGELSLADGIQMVGIGLVCLGLASLAEE